MKINNIINLTQFKDVHYGKRGTAKRDKLEKAFEAFRLGTMIQEARLDKGLRQDQLAEKLGSTKSHISKIQNNIKEFRIFTLQKIVELGFGGQLELYIKL